MAYGCSATLTETGFQMLTLRAALCGTSRTLGGVQVKSFGGDGS